MDKELAKESRDLLNRLFPILKESKKLNSLLESDVPRNFERCVTRPTISKDEALKAFEKNLSEDWYEFGDNNEKLEFYYYTIVPHSVYQIMVTTETEIIGNVTFAMPGLIESVMRESPNWIEAKNKGLIS